MKFTKRKQNYIACFKMKLVYPTLFWMY